MKINSLKIYILFLLLPSFLFSIENTPYIELGTSYEFTNSIESSNAKYVYDKSISGSVMLGYQYREHRFEFEERYKHSSLVGVKLDSGLNIAKEGDITTSSHLLNYYYNGYNTSKLVSSIGIGAGLSDIDLDGATENSLFSMQGMFSIGYMMSKHFIFTTKYTYLYITAGENLDAKVDSSVGISLRYLF